MSSIRICLSDITALDTDIIVNAANSGLQAGGGVCGAVFHAAGYDEMQNACDRIGHCDTGRAVITPGFRLKAKYVVHAVGPIWQGGTYRESEMLYSCYRESLRLALQYGCHSIGFPLISAGIYGCPPGAAWTSAIRACRDFLAEHANRDLEIIFAVLDEEILKLGETILHELAPEYETGDADSPEEGSF